MHVYSLLYSHLVTYIYILINVCKRDVYSLLVMVSDSRASLRAKRAPEDMEERRATVRRGELKPTIAVTPVASDARLTEGGGGLRSRQSGGCGSGCCAHTPPPSPLCCPLLREAPHCACAGVLTVGAVLQRLGAPHRTAAAAAATPLRR